MVALSWFGLLIVLAVIVWLIDVMSGGPRRRLVNRLMKKHGFDYRE